jgi:hypothetical protein
MPDDEDEDDLDGIDLDALESSAVACARVGNPKVTVNEDAHMTLDFGKHRGTMLQDAPLQYMIFLAGYRMWYTERIPTDLPGYHWVKTNKSAVCASAEAYLRSRCWHCGEKLVPIGNMRSNGACHDDWEDRHLHKACWKLLKNKQRREGCD